MMLGSVKGKKPVFFHLSCSIKNKSFHPQLRIGGIRVALIVFESAEIRVHCILHVSCEQKLLVCLYVFIISTAASVEEQSH